MTFSKDTIAELEKPLPHDVVRERTQAGQRLSYVEGWYCIAEANRIFGFGGWSCEVVSVTVLRSDAGGDRYTHVVRVHVRVRVGDVVRDGIGVGVGQQKDPAAAIELAEKAAETDAQKRALRSFGNRFGLALYDKEREGVGATREAQRLIDDLLKTEDVDGWVRANKTSVLRLEASDQEEVKAAAGRRRAELTTRSPARTTEAPTPPRTQVQAPLHPNAGPLLKAIEEARGAQALAELAPRIMSTVLNGSTGAVLKVYAARWAKVLGSCADATSLDAALARLTAIDPAWRELWDGGLPDVVDAARARVGHAGERQPGEEG